MATNENRLTLQDKLALVTAILLILSTVAGFVSYLVNKTEANVLSAIEKVDTNVEKVEKKIDRHIEMHLENKLCAPKESITSLLGGIYYGSGEKKEESRN